MAKSVGKYTGLQYRPLQGDVSSDILNAEDQEFRHRHEDRIEEERRARAKAAKEKARKDGLKRVKNVDLFDTGSDSLNSTLAETVRLAQQEYPKIFEVLDNPDRYSLKEQTEAQLKLNYLNEGGLVNDLKIMTSAVMEEYQGYETALNGNQIFRNEDFEKKFENGYKGVTISLDDNLRPVTLFKNTGEDVHGDGILDVETMESLNDVYSRPQFQRNVNWDAALTQHASQLKSAVNQTDNGVTSVKTTGVEENLFDSSVTRFLYNDDGTPKAAMLAFARQRNLDPNIKTNLDKIESDYKNDLLLRTERGKITNVDGGTALAYKKDARENQPSGIGEVVKPTKKTWHTYYKSINPNEVNSVPVKGVTIPLVRAEDGSELSNVNIQNYTYDTNNNMIVDLTYQDTKSITYTENQYQEELQQAIANNDYEKATALKQATETNNGRRVTLPGSNKRRVVRLSREDESLVAEKVAGSIDKARNIAFNKSNKEEEVDEFGIPINN